MWRILRTWLLFLFCCDHCNHQLPVDDEAGKWPMLMFSCAQSRTACMFSWPDNSLQSGFGYILYGHDHFTCHHEKTRNITEPPTDTSRTYGSGSFPAKQMAQGPAASHVINSHNPPVFVSMIDMSLCIKMVVNHGMLCLYCIFSGSRCRTPIGSKTSEVTVYPPKTCWWQYGQGIVCGDPARTSHKMVPTTTMGTTSRSVCQLFLSIVIPLYSVSQVSLCFFSYTSGKHHNRKVPSLCPNRPKAPNSRNSTAVCGLTDQ